MVDEQASNKRVVRMLPVTLETSQLVERGRQLAQVLTDMQSQEEIQKQQREEMKSTLARLQSERSRLTGIVSSGREPRDVSCLVYQDFSRLMVQIVREDTEEVIETRRMTEAEAQAKLPLEGEASSEADGEDAGFVE